MSLRTFVIVAMMSLSAWAQAPVPPASPAHTLTIGVTTREQVRGAFGDASVVRFANGDEVWRYSDRYRIRDLLDWLPGAAADAAVEARQLALLFDRTGVLRNYQLREKLMPSRS